ncbi:hypothetical protein QZH41_014203 [Actinostola sp. cb2023]|nr:hypothetical protein QZH41_014203 [Actinostola sp. cb2023]
MERMSFNYSTKNIPVASPKDYTKHMIDKTEQLLRRMRWKAFHFLNPELTTVKENFGFKTRNCPPVIEEMKKFEDGMISIIQNINFQDVKCQFQQDLKEDIKSVKNDKHLFVKADKSINFYKLDTSKYNQLLNDNVTKTYKKTDKKQLNKIDAAAKKIAMKLNIDDRVEITATNASKPSPEIASKYVTISADDRQIIIHAKRSLLFNNGDQWGKKTSNMLFDITMGSYDGAETCELVGCYLLSKLKQISGNDIGLYRDDGLAILNKTPKEIEKMKKEICKVFADNDLRITIEANKKVVNFLDVTLDLNTEKYKPYAKPTNIPLYVHSKSNHPHNIIKNIPESINRRLSDISSDEDVFNEAAPVYQEALRKSGYTHKLEYKPTTPTPTPKRNRHRNVIWFNPPFSKNVKSNIGKELINLIDRCFPAGHKLKKIFNRNTLKISYSCMPSVKQIIDGHNKATLKKDAQPQHDETKNTCNCRKKDECPLEGECLTKEIIYQATIKTKDTTETYVGLTATEFLKTRWRNHQMSFKHEKRKNGTELSKYLWKLKGKQEEYTLKWRILAKEKA